MNFNMKNFVLDFLNKNRIGVITTILLNDAPHSATVHFAMIEDPFSFVVLTDKNFKKAERLVVDGKTKGSMVVGFTEEEMTTFQTDGMIEVTTDPKIIDAYFAKFPEKTKWRNEEDNLFLVFKPEWWRYKEYKGEKKVVSSND